MNKGAYHTDVSTICHNKNVMKIIGNINIMDYEINKMSYLLLLSLCIEKMKSVFEKYLSNTPKYANQIQIQIQIQIFHLVVFQIQIQIQIQIFAYLNTNTNTYLTPALVQVVIMICFWPGHFELLPTWYLEKTVNISHSWFQCPGH